MGQLINVDVAAGADPQTRTFYMDRGLTGQGLRAFTSPDEADGDRSEEHLARALFAIPGVATVFAYDSAVVVSKTESASWDDLAPRCADAIRNLFVYYDVNRD
ncbi:MAG: NifU N-terminal domain-containing protein [Acidimicrobiia bacterium]|nr:NifU N-terminal domain-containing protein [Acidimicrobiia bacterium]